jgi:predicted ArsR family transcriptional regulator
MTADETRLEPARVHHETRLWIREILSQRQPMTTGEIALAIGTTMKLTLRKLADMQEARMVKVIGEAQGSNGQFQNRWALRCWKEGA